MGRPTKQRSREAGSSTSDMNQSVGALSECAPSSPDFLEDLLRGLSPDERVRVIVMPFDVSHHCVDEFGNALERPPTKPLGVQIAKEPLDDIEPRAAGWDEMNMKAPMPFEPSLYLGVLVRGVVVNDQVNVQVRRDLSMDLV